MPKHLLLSMTLRHWHGSAELITLLNCFGHCQSYSTTVELETIMANQVQQQNNILPSNIALTGNKVGHLCWDNFDVNDETPSGAGTTHSAHGILIQELQDSYVPEQTISVNIPRTKDRSPKPIDHNLITSQHFSLALLKDWLNQCTLH